MKKVFLMLLMCAAVATTASARETLEGSKLTDNLSLGVVGGVANQTMHKALLKNLKAVYGLELTKQITPIYGVALEGVVGNEMTCSATFVDRSYVGVLNKVNLNNLFSGYKGAPRPFEVEAVAGAGWQHDYYNSACGDDVNTMYTKLGLNLNFNLGKAQAWTVGIKPAIVFNMCEGASTDAHDAFNANASQLQLMAGLTYHFKASNGARSFKLAKLYDQAEIDGLNAKINDLKANIGRLNGQIGQKDATIKTLQEQLNDQRNKVAPKVVTNVTTEKEMESVVTFRQGKSTIDGAQMPNVERIATYLKNHSEAKVVIKGYASPEGSAGLNAKLAAARAEAVKNALVKKYGISAARITAAGEGVGNMFSEPDWNRVSISTIKK